MTPDIPITVDAPMLLYPTTVAAVQSRMLADPTSSHFVGLGPNGEGVHAMRVALTQTCSDITFSVVPPERDELHHVIGMTVVATPGQPFHSHMLVLDSVRLDGGDRLQGLPVALHLFEAESGSFVPVDLGVFGLFRPIELTFRLRSIERASCDVFLLVQRLMVPSGAP